MKRSEMLTVFCYDVSNNYRRSKIADILEAQTSRVQYSVFEGRLTKAKAQAIAQRIAALLEDGDSLRMYVIGQNGERRTRVFGDGPPIANSEGYWLF